MVKHVLDAVLSERWAPASSGAAGLAVSTQCAQSLPFLIVCFIGASSLDAHAHINYAQLYTRTCKQAHTARTHALFSLALRCLQWVTKRNRLLTPSGFNFCDPSSCLWSRHRTAERGPWKYLRSAAWGGGSEGKKLAFNKQDNGCHTPLLTPPLLSRSHYFVSVSAPRPLYLTFAIKITFIV